jgi:hypothetical protein
VTNTAEPLELTLCLGDALQMTPGTIQNDTLPKSLPAGWRQLSVAYRIDPLTDPRWLSYLRTNDSSSVFHAPQWLGALKLTYAYEPFVLTSSASEESLEDGLVFCKVKSWLTGSRLVSLPFSDHCQPLITCQERLDCLLKTLSGEVKEGNWKYVEIRPLQLQINERFGLTKSSSFCSHILDLRPDLDDLFRGFNKSSVQRVIRRAERRRLEYEEGRSDELLVKFYKLLTMTRRRHGLPPPPIAWFHNLLRHMGEMVKIRVASVDERPVASILTLAYKHTMVYKYGCSDARFHNLGGMHFLFWKTIQESKERGFEEFDLGRSDLDNTGLITFKDRWGAKRSPLSYYRYPALHSQDDRDDLKMHLARSVFARLPNNILIFAGRMLYRHLA